MEQRSFKMGGSTLQTVILVASGLIAVVAALMFSGIIPGFGGGLSGGGQKAQVEMWGTLPSGLVNESLLAFNDANDKTMSVTYTQKKPITYDTDILEALAAGIGPDIFIVDHDSIIKNKNKIFVWPFTSFSERGFRDRFTVGGEIFLESGGVVGIPVLIDPLVMYWNRGMFANKGIVNPPKDWTEFQEDAKQFTSIDSKGGIVFSGAAMGEFSNVKNAKEILSMLLLQSGEPITVKNGSGYDVVLGDNSATAQATQNAVSFFSGFSNVRLNTYSWNSAQPQSDDAFASGNLAMYFGMGSEVKKIKEKNPHLDFDIAPVPQLNQNSQATFGRFYAMVVPASNKQPANSMNAAIALMDSDVVKNFASGGDYAPARKDLLAQRQTGAYDAVIYKSAVQSYAWLDPNPQQTYSIFKEMVQSILSGRSSVREAIETAKNKIKNI